MTKKYYTTESPHAKWDHMFTMPWHPPGQEYLFFHHYKNIYVVQINNDTRVTIILSLSGQWYLGLIYWLGANCPANY